MMGLGVSGSIAFSFAWLGSTDSIAEHIYCRCAVQRSEGTDLQDVLLCFSAWRVLVRLCDMHLEPNGSVHEAGAKMAAAPMDLEVAGHSALAFLDCRTMRAVMGCGCGCL